MRHLVCIHKGSWFTRHCEIFSGGPAEGEIVYVVSEDIIDGKRYFHLRGYELLLGLFLRFNERHFRACDDSFGEWVESTVMKDFELEMAGGV